MSNKNYAVVKDEIVVNIIAIESLTSNLETSILQHYSANEVIEIDELDLWHVKIGSVWDGDNFIPQEPIHSSWIWNTVSKSWIPPIPKPFDQENITHAWNELEQKWEIKTT